MGFSSDFFFKGVATSTCQDIERILWKMMHPWHYEKILASIHLHDSLRKFISCIQVALSNVIGLGLLGILRCESDWLTLTVVIVLRSDKACDLTSQLDVSPLQEQWE